MNVNCIVVRLLVLSLYSCGIMADNGHISAWSSGSREFNCKMRKLAYDYGQALLPRYAKFADLYHALGLNSGCTDMLPLPTFQPQDYDLGTAPPTYASSNTGPVFYVDAVSGADTNNGGLGTPFKTLEKAVLEAAGQPGAATINLRAGRHYLASTVQLTEVNNGLTIQNYKGEHAVVSGAKRLTGAWQPHTLDGKQQANQFVLDTSSSGLTSVPGLQVNGVRMTRARYPNGNVELPESGHDAGNPLGARYISSIDTSYILPDPTLKAEVYTNTDPQYYRNKSTLNRWGRYTLGYGGQCHIYEPPVSYWCSNETSGGGGVGFVMFRGLQPNTTKNSSIGLHMPYDTMEDAVVFVNHPARWSNYMFSVKAYNRSTGEIVFDKGGFQGSRGVGMIKAQPARGLQAHRGGDWFVENVREEWDYPNEFFWDKHAQKLYYYHNSTDEVPMPPLTTDADYDVPQLSTLFNLTAVSRWQPIRNVTIRGITMTGTRYTYLDPHGVPSAGDMAVARVAAVFLEGTEGVVVSNCKLTRLDGNAIMV